LPYLSSSCEIPDFAAQEAAGPGIFSGFIWTVGKLVFSRMLHLQASVELEIYSSVLFSSSNTVFKRIYHTYMSVVEGVAMPSNLACGLDSPNCSDFMNFELKSQKFWDFQTFFSCFKIDVSD